MPVILTPVELCNTVCSTEPVDLLDTTCDWRVYDGLNSITLWKRLPVPTSYNIVNTLFRFTVDSEAQVSNGVYIRFTGTYFLPAELVDINIEVGDYIVDNSGYNWIIQKVDSPYTNEIGTSWQLLVNSLRFNLPLINTIDYYSAVSIVDDFGGRVLTEELLYSNLVAAIQPVNSEDDLQADSRLYHNTNYYIWIEEDIKARIGDLMKDNNDNWYKIESVQNRERIDEFTQLLVKSVINKDELDA